MNVYHCPPKVSFCQRSALKNPHLPAQPAQCPACLTTESQKWRWIRPLTYLLLPLHKLRIALTSNSIKVKGTFIFSYLFSLIQCLMSESMTSYLKMWDRESEKNMKTPIIYPIFKGDTGGDSNLPSTLPTTATISRLEWKFLGLKKHLICIFVSGATPGQCDRGSLRLMDAYMRTQIHLSHSVISSYKGTTWEGALRKLCIPIDKNRLHFDVLHYSASEGVPVGN